MFKQAGTWLLILLLSVVGAVGHYTRSDLSPEPPKQCPDIEVKIRGRVKAAIDQDPDLAAGLLRLHFHDCFVNGCDASILLDSPNNDTERYAEPNKSLQQGAFDLVNEIKEGMKNMCNPETKISCADILALAARDAVFLRGGPYWLVKYGRLDGSASTKAAPLEWLPNPRSGVNQAAPATDEWPAGKPLIESFRNVGLGLRDLVALSGAHTLGVADCDNFADRLEDSSVNPIDEQLRNQLRLYCNQGRDGQQQGGQDSGDEIEVDLDAGPEGNFPRTGGLVFDNSYFKNLLRARGLLTSDQSLATTPSTAKLVKKYARSEKAFFHDFAQAMIRMSEILPVLHEPARVQASNSQDGGAERVVYPGNEYGIRKGRCCCSRV